jgi:hypothetical protein
MCRSVYHLLESMVRRHSALPRAGRSPKREQNKANEGRRRHARQQYRDNLEVQRSRVFEQVRNERTKAQTGHNENPINPWSARLFRPCVRPNHPARLVKDDQDEQGNTCNHREPNGFFLIVHGLTVFGFNRRLTTELSCGRTAQRVGCQLQRLVRWRVNALDLLFSGTGRVTTHGLGRHCQGNCCLSACSEPLPRSSPHPSGKARWERARSSLISPYKPAGGR